MNLFQKEIDDLVKLKDIGLSVKNCGHSKYLIENSFYYWPKDDLYIFKKTNERGRGINNLIKRIFRARLSNKPNVKGVNHE